MSLLSVNVHQTMTSVEIAALLAARRLKSEPSCKIVYHTVHP